MPFKLRFPQSAFRYPIFSFIARFGFHRGIEFRRVAAKCDRDPHLLRSWETHYRARASREFAHDNQPDGRVFLAFAEMLATTRDTLIRKRKARRALVEQQNRKIERALKKLKADTAGPASDLAAQKRPAT